MKCPCTGVNVPRFLSATIAGMIFLYAYEYFVHVQWLMPSYEETPELWRSYGEMQDLASWSFVRLFLTVATIGYLYTLNHEGKGAGEGFRFGLAVGLVLAVMNASSYLWMPISSDLAINWAIAGVGMGIGLGVVFSLLYSPCKEKKKAAPVAAVTAPAKKKAPAKKSAAKKKTTVKKATAKKKAPAKKTAAKKTAAKRKPAAKKTTAKKAPAKKSTAKKATTKRKTPAKKTATKKTTRKTTKKSSAKK